MTLARAIRRGRWLAKECIFWFIVMTGLILLHRLLLPCFWLTEHPKWPRSTPRNMSLYIYPEKDTSILTPNNRCKLSLDLLIIICSAVDRQKVRLSIRNTWANKEHINSLNASVKVLFLLGQSNNDTLNSIIADEARNYGDIIQEKFYDAYYNLVIKSGMMLKWVTTHCPQATYVMKTDDDMFITLPNLLRVLPPRSTSSNVLLGRLVSDQIPVLNSCDRWYTPKYMHSKETFPDFVSGTGYVMSMDVAFKLYNASLSTPMIVLEDVYITGLCAEKAGIQPINHSGFSFSPRELNICLPKDSITAHEVNTCMMYAIWNRTRSSNKWEIPCLQLPRLNRLNREAEKRDPSLQRHLGKHKRSSELDLP